MLIGIEKEEQVELSAAQEKYSRLKDSLKPIEAEAHSAFAYRTALIR